MEETKRNECIVPISIGELFDKFTILTIKRIRLQHDPRKMEWLNGEWSALEYKVQLWLQRNPEGERIFNELRNCNEVLWDIEENIRKKESEKCFDAEFIQLARSVYMMNDRRAGIKKAINQMYDSAIVEVKSYLELEENDEDPDIPSVA